MSAAVFGRDITLNLDFSVDGKLFEPVADQTIFAALWESQPSLSQITGQSGFITGTSVTSWTKKGPRNYEVVIPAIDDDDRESSNRYEQRYFGISYVNQTGKQTQAQWRGVLVFRAHSTFAQMNVTAEEVTFQDSPFELTFDSNLTIEQYISDARELIINKFTSRDYDPDLFTDLQKANLALKFYTKYLMSVDLIQSGGDGWDRKSERYKELADSYLSGARVRYDRNKDKFGLPETETVTALSDAPVLR